MSEQEEKTTNGQTSLITDENKENNAPSEEMPVKLDFDKIYPQKSLCEITGNDENGNQTVYHKLIMHLRIEISEVTSVDTQTQRYGIKGTIKRMWKATDKDQDNFNKDKTKYTPQFEPQFNFLNAVECKQHEPQRVTIKTFTNKDGENKKYNIQSVLFNMTFTQQFNIINFPFDVQDLTVRIKEARNNRQLKHDVPPNEIYKQYIMFDKTWSNISNWNVANVNYCFIPEKSKSSATGQTYETIVFRIQVKRKWKGVVYRLALWLLFLGMVSHVIYVYISFCEIL